MFTAKALNFDLVVPITSLNINVLVGGGGGGVWRGGTDDEFVILVKKVYGSCMRSASCIAHGPTALCNISGFSQTSCHIPFSQQG